VRQPLASNEGPLVFLDVLMDELKDWIAGHHEACYANQSS